MKKLATPLLILLTFMLIATTLMALWGAAPIILASFQCLAFFLLPFAVYRVLREPHHTELRFEDWYADAPKIHDN